MAQCLIFKGIIMKLMYKIRQLLWHILGISYDHMQKIVDVKWLKEDKYTAAGTHFMTNNTKILRWSDAEVKIGKYSTASYDTTFIVDDGGHTYNKVTSYAFKWNQISEKKGIVIGNDAIIYSGCIILPGVKIGNGATVAAGSVVVHDVPDYCIVGGAPAKIVKRKCTEEEAAEMAKIAWWDWDEKTIEERKDDFRLEIPEFIAKYKQV